MKLLVGLGNPGDGHRATRHNVGFMVIEEIRRRGGGSREERAARSMICKATTGGGAMVLARPMTYMNRSGEAVVALLNMAEASPEDLLVLCDDIHLDFGTLRLRARGSHGGHNGLRSIIAAIGTSEFARLRVGVGPADRDADHAGFVLAPFTRTERAHLEAIIARAADCSEMAVAEGVQHAMNRFNRRQGPDEARGEGVS